MMNPHKSKICWKMWLLAFIIGIVALTDAADVVKPEKVTYLEAGDIVDFQPKARRIGFFESDLRTYCYNGAEKTLGRFFETVELQLDIANDDYTQYEGQTPQEVRDHYEEKRSLFSFSLFAQKRARLQLSPFRQQCIGIETTQEYRVRLLLVRVDFWRVIQLSLAVLLFIYSHQLSHNSFFYYCTGVLLGICSSFMLLIWLTSKLVPKRPVMYGVLIGGWTIGIYVIQMLWENLQLIVVTYRTYVFWYITVTGLLSFFFCYRLGPPKNKRSQDIVKWLLQLIAMLLIYLSSYFEEATAAVIILTAVIYYFPLSIFRRVRAAYLRKFPPKRRLLSAEEFDEQAVRETTKALDELRNYASSPECKQWKVMSKLRDPMRFAAFVEGASHLRDDEILHYEGSKYEESDYEEDMSEEEGEYAGPQQNRRPEAAAYSYTKRSVIENTDDEEEEDEEEVHRNERQFSANRKEFLTHRYAPIMRTPATHSGQHAATSPLSRLTPTSRAAVTTRRGTPEASLYRDGAATTASTTTRRMTPTRRSTTTTAASPVVRLERHESPLQASGRATSANRLLSRSARLVNSAQQNHVRAETRVSPRLRTTVYSADDDEEY